MHPTKTAPDRMTEAWRRHERRWKDHRFVYAVVSRRSRGISIGINLNPGKTCNFNCIYCQVNRSIPGAVLTVDLKRLAEELDSILQAEKLGSLYDDAPFDVLAPEERGVRDIAFSGDGEPTIYPRLVEAVEIAAHARVRYGLDSTRIILITDAAYLRKPVVCSALEIMDRNNGEIWAKLDAGSEEYFRRVNRPNISLDRVLENILEVSRVRPLVIQSLWFRIQGAKPPLEELETYCRRLQTLLSAGGQVKGIQLYTIARDPAESYASPLEDEELEQIASLVKARVPVPVETYK